MQLDLKRLCHAGTLLRDFLARNELKQSWLIGQLDISRAMLWQWMTGKRTPHIDSCARIERITGIPASMWATRPELRPPTMSQTVLERRSAARKGVEAVA